MLTKEIVQSIKKKKILVKRFTNVQKPIINIGKKIILMILIKKNPYKLTII